MNVALPEAGPVVTPALALLLRQAIQLVRDDEARGCNPGRSSQPDRPNQGPIDADDATAA